MRPLSTVSTVSGAEIIPHLDSALPFIAYSYDETAEKGTKVEALGFTVLEKCFMLLVSGLVLVEELLAEFAMHTEIGSEQTFLTKSSAYSKVTVRQEENTENTTKIIFNA